MINSGPDDTGHTIAPNMFWPATVALGANLPASRKLHALELHPDSPKKNALLTLPQYDSGDSINLSSRDIDPCKLTINKEFEDPSHDDIAVHIALTRNSDKLTIDHINSFSVGEIYKIKPVDTKHSPLSDPNLDYCDTQLRAQALQVADTLISLARDNPSKQFIIFAMMPKVVALAIGWILIQHNVKLFERTHLMHYDQEKGRYIPLRVRANQPDTLQT
ncbi:hypothetical protein F8178_04020 [Haloechinothrix sp. LS1_15]|nr:hypothetical protein [Haloechinothrix sp. LS1_15]